MYGPFDIDYRSYIKNKKNPTTYCEYISAKFDVSNAIIDLHKHFNYFGLPDPNINNSYTDRSYIYNSVHFNSIEIIDNYSSSFMYKSLFENDSIYNHHLSPRNLFKNTTIINGRIKGLFKYHYLSYKTRLQFICEIDGNSEDQWIDYYKSLGYAP